MIQNQDVTDIKPIMTNGDQTSGNVPSTNTTYNQSNVTYSSPTQTYGGITGALFGVRPQMQEVVN